MPAFVVLLWRVKGLRLLAVGDTTADVDDRGRNALVDNGLDALRRSLSFSPSESLTLTGDGESSMISTHPDVSGADAFFSFLSAALSILRLPLKPSERLDRSWEG
jgi:hypothetical protein